MAESAIHLCDEVFPENVLVRQWVLSMPTPLRYMCAKNSGLKDKILKLTNRVIAHAIKESVPHFEQDKVRKLEAGAVTLIQRFGGHVNLNIHFHMLHIQGAWEISTEPKGADANSKSQVLFRPANNPSDDVVTACVRKIAQGTLKILKRLRLVEKDESGHDVLTPTDDEDPLSDIQSASTQNKIARGERKGKAVRRLIEQFDEEVLVSEPKITGPLVASYLGFSLHAAVVCPSQNKARLAQLVRYTARPAVAEERLSQKPNGDIHYKLKRPWSDGTTQVVFSALEFLEKLAALVPPPRIHLTRFHGILAPHSKFRALVVPKKMEAAQDQAPGSATCEHEKTLALEGGLDANLPNGLKKRRIAWAKLLSHVFDIDMESCELCGRKMKAISAIMKLEVIIKILNHLGHPPRPPPISTSRFAHQEDLWNSVKTPQYDEFGNAINKLH
jgi:hypothetical protein